MGPRILEITAGREKYEITGSPNGQSSVRYEKATREVQEGYKAYYGEDIVVKPDVVNFKLYEPVPGEGEIKDEASRGRFRDFYHTDQAVRNTLSVIERKYFSEKTELDDKIKNFKD